MSKDVKTGKLEETEAKAIPLAIVGIGCLFPKAGDARAYWTNIRDGVDAIDDIPDTHWKPDEYFDADPDRPDMTYARRGGFIDPVDFDPLLYGLSPNNLEATDSTQLLGMVVARQALLDAGYATARDSDDGRQFDRDRTSVILGVTGTLELVIPLGARLGHPIWRQALADAGIDKETADDIVERIGEGYVPWQENSFPGLLGNVAAGRIANRFDLGGTNCVVDAACASSLSAVHMAAMELYAGRADMAITGGLDTFNDIFMYMCFSKTPALSPTGNSKPFDHNGDGTILGEGLGAVVLKRLDDAERDGDKIYAVIKGIGSSSDGRGNAIYAPSAAGQTKALKDAYDQAGISPRSIELVEAHGTGTKVGDAVEAEALSGVYREAQEEGSWAAIGSVKSNIGHAKAAAGVAGLIKVAMALKNKTLPPTIKVEKPLDMLDPGTAPVYVNASKRPWISATSTPRRGALSAFGFGGSNFHCVLEEVEEEKANIEWDGQVLLLALSGDDTIELKNRLSKLELEKDYQHLRAEAARSLEHYDASQPHRLVLVLTADSDLKSLVADCMAQLDKEGETHWQLRSGAYYGSGESVGEPALLFPGQGSQYTGMLLDLACQFPGMQQALMNGQAIKEEVQGGELLNNLVHPISVFDAKKKEENESRLRLTQHAQPALGACSAGAYRVLEHFGVKPSATAGHSFGELTALFAAGKISESDLHRLANKRGELMQAKDGDHGAMLAVSASAAIVHEFLEAEPLDLIIANNNAPTQVVLSGASADVDIALERFRDRGVSATKLPVSAAFHSIYVAEAEKPFAEFMQDIEFKKGDVLVYANTTAEVYPAGAEEARTVLAGQLARPVEFVTQVENMYEAGARCFVEVGPGKVLSSLVGAILGEKEHHSMSLDPSKGRKGGQYDLACLLAQLSVLGCSVDVEKWDAGYLESIAHLEKEKSSRMTIPINGANHVMQRERKAKAAPKPAPQVASPAAPTSAPAATASTTTPVSQGAAVSSANPNALVATQQSILALQKMQEQTAQLHRQYLESQEQALQNIQQLIQQQNQLFSGQVLTGQPITPLAPAPITQAPVTPAPASTTAAPQPATVAQAPAPAPVAEAAPAPQPAADNAAYEKLLLEVVAEKTGYPVEMLSMDMSLDTDLGIDSIKRVEILSTLQEKLPAMSKVQPEELGTFQMLKHIVEFLAEGVPQESPAEVAAAQPAVANDKLQNALLEVVAEKTGYPVDMLQLEMNLDSDLGIDSIKRVEILSAFQEKMPEAPTVNPEDLASLQTLQQIVDFMQASAPAVPAAPVGSTTATGPAAAVDNSRLQAALLEVVAEKTGYPVDMLQLEMNLDSDLGIDSIKRVEILSAFQEKMPEAPTVNPEDLASLQTLQQIVDFMQASAPAVAAAATTTPAAGPAASVDNDVLQQALLEVVAEKTGYPVDMLQLDMHLDSDLGIDSIKRVEILSAFQEKVPEAPAVNPEELASLQTLQQIVDHMAAGSAAADSAGSTATAPVEATDTEDSNELYRGVVEAIALDAQGEALQLPKGRVLVLDDGSELVGKIIQAFDEKGVSAELTTLDASISDDVVGLLLATPANADEEFLHRAFALLQKASAVLKTNSKKGDVLLAGMSRLGGRFGLDGTGSANPESGGLAGIIKTADKEWPEVTCRMIDIPAKRNSIKLAQKIVEELGSKGALEVGLDNDARYQLRLNKQAIEAAGDRKLLDEEDVLIVTGGARGVTAEVAEAMAGTYGCKLLLLGRSPLPEDEPDWLEGISDEAAIKQAIINNSDEKLSPKEVEKRFSEIEKGREIINNITRMGEVASRVVYCAVDVTDEHSVKQLIDEARNSLGPIAGIVHGAGVLADRLIEDKTREQFESVYATKVHGLRYLLEACRHDSLKMLVTFSSSTARYGRKGQVDYAVANEVLNKMAQAEHTRRDDCRVVSVNWGPWDGGMVTPQLKKLFESEGVGVIPLKAGADYLVDEVSKPGPVEVVILGSDPLEEENDTAGTVATAHEVPTHTVMERSLSVADYPVLASHVMNGRAVLPAALIAEWLAHGAMHNHPGMSFTGINDFKVFKGVVLEQDESRELQVMAGVAVMEEDRDRIHMELRSGDVLHASAEVILGHSHAGNGEKAPQPLHGDGYKEPAFYDKKILFHGPALQCIDSIEACAEKGIRGKSNAAPAPAEWMKQPMRSSWLADPLVMDAAFQMAILWSTQEQGKPCLPTGFKSYRQFQRQFPADGATIQLDIEKATQHQATARIHFIDSDNRLIATIEAYECVMDASLQQAFERNSLSSSVKA